MIVLVPAAHNATLRAMHTRRHSPRTRFERSRRRSIRRCRSITRGMGALGYGATLEFVECPTAISRRHPGLRPPHRLRRTHHRHDRATGVRREEMVASPSAQPERVRHEADAAAGTRRDRYFGAVPLGVAQGARQASVATRQDRVKAVVGERKTHSNGAVHGTLIVALIVGILTGVLARPFLDAWLLHRHLERISSSEDG